MTSRMGIFAIAFSLLATGALAWGPRGHMMVAEVAWKHMDAQSRQRAAALIKLNPDYNAWTQGVAPAERDQYAFVRAARWPDDIKSKPDYTNDTDTPSGPDVARNIGYQDHIQHRYWHFVDMPFSTDHTPLKEPLAPNAETEIETFASALSSPATNADTRSYDLVWLLHLVGDVHQPLHTTSRFSHDLPGGDHGGNLVKLCANCRAELHAFWDNVPGTNTSESAAIAAADALPEPDSGEASISDDRTWIAESFAIAKSSAYAGPVGNGKGPFYLDAAYKAKARQIADRQIALAGVRLANLIKVDLH